MQGKWSALAAILVLSATAASPQNFHRDPNYSDVCIGGDCVTYLVPVYSKLILEALCDGGRTVFRSHSWKHTYMHDGRPNTQTVSSPTCSWNFINADGSLELRTAVAFDEDGLAYVVPGIFKDLEQQGALVSPPNALIISTSYENVKADLPVYYSDFSREALAELGVRSWHISDIDVYESDKICMLGRFDPVSDIFFGDQRTIRFGPACFAIDPDTNKEEIVVLFDSDGRGIKVNEDVVEKLINRRMGVD